MLVYIDLLMRIAHLSDLHLLSFEGARFGDFLSKRWTGGVNMLLNRGKHYQAGVFDALVDDVNALGVEHVACTGDITNLSLAAEFRFARTKFERFALGPAHVTCIPGNHDTYVADMAGAFEQEFAAYCKSDDGFSSGWPVVRVRGDVAVIGLSTSRASTWFMAHGSLGDEQLRRFDAVLGDPRLGGKFRLVMIHHPPAGKASASSIRGLHDRHAFADVISRHGVDLVLHGHEHLDLRGELSGRGGTVVPVRGIQSGTYDHDVPRRRARYRIYEIQDARLVSEQLRMWDHVGKKWIVDPSQRTGDRRQETGDGKVSGTGF
jgi:3',5'-cyclic AMP phosphodiesterase CpdA